VPIALGILVFAARLIPADRGPGRNGRGYDVLGAVLSTAAMLLLVYAIVSAPQVGWASGRTLGSFVAVAALIVAFVAVERRTPHPLVRLGVLRNRSLVGANLTAMTVFGSYVGFQFIGTLYMQNLLGWSPLAMALAFLPAGLIVAFGGPRTDRLVDRFGTGKVIAAGLAMFVPGYALFLRIDEHPAYAAVILPTMLLLGAGFALAFPSLNIQATAGVSDDEQGLASGLVQTSFQVGGAVVLAAVTAVIAAHGGAQATTPHAVLGGYYPALGVVTGVAGLGLVIAVVTTIRRRTARHAAQ
jgi:predicted MFS family arabinose efflux permease